MTRYKDEYLKEFGDRRLPFEYAFWISDLTKDYSRERRASGWQDESKVEDVVVYGHLYEATISTFGLVDTGLTFRFRMGDVLISLAPLGTDELFLPGTMLVEKSPWFKAALGEVWEGDKVPDLEDDAADETACKRFELVYEQEGGSRLQSKMSYARFFRHSAY